MGTGTGPMAQNLWTLAFLLGLTKTRMDKNETPGTWGKPSISIPIHLPATPQPPKHEFSEMLSLGLCERTPFPQKQKDGEIYVLRTASLQGNGLAEIKNKSIGSDM